MQQGTSPFPSLGLSCSICKTGCYTRPVALNGGSSAQSHSPQVSQIKRVSRCACFGTSFCLPGSWVSPSPTRCIESPFRTVPGWHSNPATPLVPHCSTDCVTASSGHTASWAGRPQYLDTSHAYYRKRPPSQERKFSNQGNR